MTNKQKYREFCKKEKNIPIFSRDWWFDSVCGDNWNVAIVEKGGEIWATMPYCVKKKFGFTLITMPLLTQTLGPYIKYPKNQKYYKKLSWEKEIMNTLIGQLIKFDYFNQNWHYSVTNWLPFYWKKFKQTTRYTYIIENLTIEELEKNFETDVRRRIKKAIKAGVEIFESNDIKRFYELNKMTFKRQNLSIPYSFEFVKNLYEKAKDKNAVKMYFAKYKDEIIAANFLVYDENTVYYLMGGIDSTKKNLGGMDLLLYDSIKFALNNGRKFDFEGSMIESIEKYFRSFGAIQKPYFAVYKFNSKILEFVQCFRDIIK
jgi:lipid II:glycine glycyltransferase (peptidoglycan interpeptide bridge formation enzyme)